MNNPETELKPITERLCTLWQGMLEEINMAMDFPRGIERWWQIQTSINLLKSQKKDERVRVEVKYSELGDTTFGSANQRMDIVITQVAGQRKSSILLELKCRSREQKNDSEWAREVVQDWAKLQNVPHAGINNTVLTDFGSISVLAQIVLMPDRDELRKMLALMHNHMRQASTNLTQAACDAKTKVWEKGIVDLKVCSVIVLPA